MSILHTTPISETQRRTKTENDLTATAINKLNTDLSAEKSNRENADAAMSQALTTLNNKVDNAITGNNSAIDETKSELNQKINSAISRFDTNIDTVRANLTTETARAKQREDAVESDLIKKLESEQSARALADVNLTTQMKALNDAEVDTRKKADDELSAKIAKEITDRADAENSIKQTIQNNVANLAPKANPTFTGTPIVPAASDQTPDNQIANVKYVKDKVAEVNAKLVTFTKATATTDGKAGLVPAQGKTSKKQVLTSDGWANMDAAGMTLALPSQNGKLTFNGNSQTPSWNNYDPAKMTLTVTAQINAGTYTAKVKPTGLYVWSDTEQQTEREISWTIDPLLLPKPSASVTQFTFNNANQGINVNNYDSTYENQTGTISASDANTYEATYSLKNTNNTKWSDNSTAAVKISWNIAVLKIDKPTASGQIEFDYDKTVHAPIIANFNETYIARTGTYSTADAGEFTITFSIKQNGNVHWKDDTTAAVNISWKIVVRELEKPTLTVDTFTFSYANQNGVGTIHSVTVNHFDERFMTQSGVTSASDAGVYSVTFELRDSKYKWQDKTTAPIVLSWRISPAKISAPTLASDTATYTGGFIYVQMKDYGQNFLSGCASGSKQFKWTTALPQGMSAVNDSLTNAPLSANVINAGTYNFSITPNANHIWADTENRSPKSYSFTVNKKSVSPPTLTGGGVYKNAAYNVQWTGFDNSIMSKIGTESATNVGVYAVYVSLKDTNNYQWTSGSSDNLIFNWEITRCPLTDKQSNLYQDSPFVFSGNTLTFTPENYSQTYHVLSGDLTGRDAGTYYAQVTPTDNFCWNDGKTDVHYVKWIITKSDSITRPTAAVTKFFYTAKEISLTVDGLMTSYVKLKSGTTKATDVGNYEVVYELIDPDNYSWSNGKTDEVHILWSIQKETVTKPALQTKSFTYSSTTTRTPTFTSTFNADKINVSGDTSKKDAGNYTITCSLKDKNLTTWTDGSTDDVNFAWVINRAKISSTYSNVKQSGTLTYTGGEQNLTVTNFNEAYHVISGQTKATEAGTYYAYVSLTPNYFWSDGTDVVKTVEWKIGVLELTKPECTSDTEFTFNNKQISLTFNEFNLTHISMTGTSSAVDEGNYTCTFALKNKKSTQWAGGGIEDISFNWSIEKVKITIPTLIKTSLLLRIYTGTNKPTTLTASIKNYSGTYMTKSGDLSAAYPGKYCITVSLKDPVMYKWEDGTIDDIKLYWEITKTTIDYIYYYVNNNGTWSSVISFKTGNSRIYSVTYNASETNIKLNIYYRGYQGQKPWLVSADDIQNNDTDPPPIYKNLLESLSGTLSATDAGTYSVTVKPKGDLILWYDTGTDEARTFEWTIKPAKISTMPTVSEENVLTYNGTTSTNGTMQSIALVGYDPETMTLSGTTSASDAGTYECTIAPDKNHCWKDGSQSPISFQWTILPKVLNETQSNLQINGSYQFDATKKNITVKNSNQIYHTINADRTPMSSSSKAITLSEEWLPSLTVYTCKNFVFSNNTTKKVITVDFKPKVLDRPVVSGNYDFTYDGTEKHIILTGYDPNWVVVDEDNTMFPASKICGAKKTERGHYKICYFGRADKIAKGDGRCVWSADKYGRPFVENIYPDQEAPSQQFYSWNISDKIYVKYPTLKQSIFKYDGNEHTVEIENFDENIMYMDDTWGRNYKTSATDIGDYGLWFELKDTSKYEWDGWKNYLISWTIPWYIVGEEVTAPTITSATEFEYDGKTKSVTLTSFDGSKIIQEGYLSATAVGTYTITLTPAVGNLWADTKNNTPRVYTWKIVGETLPESLATFSQKTVLTYTGKNQTVTIAGYNASYHILSGTTTAKDAGTYTAVVTCKPQYVFSDETTSKNVSWTIRPMQYDKPTISANSYVYAEGENPTAIANFDEKVMSVTYKRGTTVVGTDFSVGSYTATIALLDKTNSTWTDGKTNDVVLSFSITAFKLTKPTCANNSFYYNSTTTVSIADYLDGYDSSTMTLGSTATAQDAGNYTVTVALKDKTNNTWADGKTTDVSISWVIERFNLNIMPTYIRQYYTIYYKAGVNQSVSLTYFNSATMTLSGQTSAELPGSYQCTVALKSNYKWADGSTANKVVTWQIYKMKIYVPEFDGDSSFVYDGKTHSVKYVLAAYDGSTTKQPVPDGVIAVTGTTSTSAVGNYTLTFKINDTNKYQWYDGTTADKTLNWNIGTGSFAKPEINADLTYNGKAQSPVINNFNSTFMELSSQTSMTNAGTYTVVVKLKDKNNYKWSDNSTGDISLKWTIARKSAGVASTAAIAYNTLTFNDANQNLVITSHPADYFSYSGTTSAKNAGSYTVTITPKDNYCWSDGSTASQSFTWTIKPKSTGVAPTAALVYDKIVYDGKNHTIVSTKHPTSMFTYSGQKTFSYAGSFTVNIKPIDNYCWSDGSTASQSFTWTIERKPLDIASTAVDSYAYKVTYTGEHQTVNNSDRFTSTYYKIAGTTYGTNAGKYSITLTPTANYCWKNGDTGAVTTYWEITKAVNTITTTGSLSLTVDMTYLSQELMIFMNNFNRFGHYGLTYSALFDNTFTYESSNPDVISCQNGVLYIQHNGSCTIYISSSASDNYTSHKIAVNFTVNIALANMPWNKVSTLVKSGRMGDFVNVGDSVAIDSSTHATLVGIDHNIDVEYAVSSGTTKDSSIQHLAHFAVLDSKLSLAHKTVKTNKVNWPDSDIFTYLNNTYLDSLPNALKNVICTVTKWTHNYKDYSTSSNYSCTPTKFWLPAATEITTGYNRLFVEMYEYFKAGNHCPKTWIREPVIISEYQGEFFCHNTDDPGDFSGRDNSEKFDVIPFFAVG